MDDNKLEELLKTLDEDQLKDMKDTIQYIKTIPEWDWKEFGKCFSKDWLGLIKSEVGQSAVDQFISGIMEVVAN